MKKSVFVWSFVLAAAARSATAQEIDALIPGDRAASAELAKIVESTRQSGLPVEPVLAKIQYGLRVAKAPPPMIINAARAIAARLEEARKALAPHPTENDIKAGENALMSKVSSKSLQDIRKVAPDRPVAVPLGVLAQLVTNGVEEKRAAKIVADLIRRRATADQIVALGNDVYSDIRAGTAANNALDLRMNRLNAILAPPSAAAATAAEAFTTGDGRKKP